jgi:hypothetical protein
MKAAVAPLRYYKGYKYCSRGETVRSRSVRSKVIREVGGVADKEVFTVHTINIISQRQYIAARCLMSWSVMFFVCTVYAFVFLLPASQ